MALRNCLIVTGLMLIAVSLVNCRNTGGLERVKPNILIIVADDLGWNDVGWHNPQIETPHLNALGRSGVFLERHYVAPSCIPTRMALLTGRFPHTVGHPSIGTAEIGASEVFLPERLAALGYEHRALFGKWHLGEETRNHPLNRGFTQFRGCVGGGVVYETGQGWGSNHPGTPQWFDGPDHVTPVGGYVTFDTGQGTIGFIEAHANDSTPWFCMTSFTAPHTPIHRPPVSPHGVDWAAKYEGIQTTEKRQRHLLAAMISYMDERIGDIVAALDATGQRENTLVLFMSDNGGLLAAGADNAPLLGGKLDTLEGGIRVPALVSWPEEIAAGTICHELTMHTDYAPTALQAAHGDLHSTNFEGMSISRVLSHGGQGRVYTYVSSRTSLEVITVSQRDKVRRFLPLGAAGASKERYALVDNFIDETNNVWGE